MLYAVVRDHLQEFIEHADENYARPLPRYVRAAFEAYLRCGLPEFGFLRLRCDDCGHDRVVAFSCKQRGPCPSCSARTMSNVAAHITDRVLPNVPLRQWVLSLPFDIRALAARRPDVVAAIDRILFSEIERWMRRTSGPADGRAGAITFVQRFGGSLNLHVHLHVLVPEGLFTRGGDDLPLFHPASSPTRADLFEVVTRVRDRVRRWVHRHQLDESAIPAEDAALDACARIAIQRGLFDSLPTPMVEDADEPPAQHKHSVALDQFNLHAAVRIAADDDLSRERLIRYCARPPFALERLTVTRDGRIAYQIKQPRKGATHRILTPMELLARVTALIPPPRHPFIRYHGVLAPNAKWRKAIVPRGTSEAPNLQPPIRPPPAMPTGRTPASQAPAATPTTVPVTASASPSTPATPRSSNKGGPHGGHTIAHRAQFATISPRHRARLLDGALLAERPRLDWARLLRRTFAEDVLVCPQCRGSARVIAAVHDPASATMFLDAITERSTPTAPAAPLETSDHSAPDDDCQLPPPSSRPPSLPHRMPDD